LDSQQPNNMDSLQYFHEDVTSNRSEDYFLVENTRCMESLSNSKAGPQSSTSASNKNKARHEQVKSGMLATVHEDVEFSEADIYKDLASKSLSLDNFHPLFSHPISKGLLEEDEPLDDGFNLCAVTGNCLASTEQLSLRLDRLTTTDTLTKPTLMGAQCCKFEAPGRISDSKDSQPGKHLKPEWTYLRQSVGDQESTVNCIADSNSSWEPWASKYTQSVCVQPESSFVMCREETDSSRQRKAEAAGDQSNQWIGRLTNERERGIMSDPSSQSRLFPIESGILMWKRFSDLDLKSAVPSVLVGREVETSQVQGSKELRNTIQQDLESWNPDTNINLNLLLGRNRQYIEYFQNEISRRPSLQANDCL
jgi:hypothetical protein